MVIDWALLSVSAVGCHEAPLSELFHTPSLVPTKMACAGEGSTLTEYGTAESGPVGCQEAPASGLRHTPLVLVATYSTS